MNVAYLFDPVKQFVSRNGIPLAGGFLNVFVGESQEPADTFSDAAGTVLNPKRIPIDSAGRALGVFVDDSKLYTLKAYNAGGELQFSIYPVAPGKGGGGGGGNSYYYPGDEYIYIDQDAREISLHNTKAIRGDEETITMEDTQNAIILHVNPDIIGEEAHVAAGEHTSVDYDSDSNTYTVNAEYAGSDTIDIDSDGVISGKYKGGYGIEINGNTISKTHHKLMATNNVTYNYCKVFDFTWQHVYGRGQCVFTATHYGGDYVTFAVSLTRALGADYTIAWPYVVSASPYMAKNGFVERLEIREIGSRIVGYLKLRSFSQSQFWLDWEGSSNAGIVSFTPQLTNSPEGEIVWTRNVGTDDVFYSQYEADRTFQKKLTAGRNITIDSDNVISSSGEEYNAGWGITIDSDNNEIAVDPSILPDENNVFIATYGTTSYEDVKAAIDEGKLVFLKDGRIQYTVVSNWIDMQSIPAVLFGAMIDQWQVSFPKRSFITVRNVSGQGTEWKRWATDRIALYDELPLIATYGSTSYNDITTAVNKNRVVVLKTTNSAENVDWACYGGHDVYPDTNEHYFFGLGNGGQRYIYTVNSSNRWTQTAIDENGGKVFFATYDSTSFSDIKNALTQGKYVVAKSGHIYYTLSHAFDERIIFMGKTSLVANVDNFIEVDSDNVWTTTNAALAVTSFTAHGSVTTTDAYNDVGHTSSFAIGQKGTHGGVLDIGAKIGAGGWTGDYKVFTRLYHNSTSTSAPASGSTMFGPVTLGSEYINIGSVSQYLLMTGVQWTYIIELAYSASPGRSLRLTISGIGSTDITYFAEEIR